MIWHYFTTIAATVLITLPFQLNASHCNEKSWNHILNVQLEIDENYNFHASRFNRFLKRHKERPFLFQEFSNEELKQLWAKKDPIYQTRMQEQLHASLTVIGLIEQERQNLAPLIQRIANQQQDWIEISQHCDNSASTINMVTGLNYSQLNQALIKDTTLLIKQLDILKRHYVRELDALEQSRPKPFD